MDILPLTRIGDDEQLDYGDGTIKASVAAPLPHPDYDDVTVTPIQTGTGTTSPYVVSCPGENPDDPDQGCDECRLTGCNPGPPSTGTQMRHVRMLKQSVSYDAKASRFTFSGSVGGPALTFPGAMSLSELHAALWDRVGGPQPGMLFQIYKIDTWRELPLSTYVAIPVAKLS